MLSIVSVEELIMLDKSLPVTDVGFPLRRGNGLALLIETSAFF